MELKEALEEERSFSDRLLEGIDRVLDMLERHLPCLLYTSRCV